jgi:hypothetical protein
MDTVDSQILNGGPPQRLIDRPVLHSLSESPYDQLICLESHFLYSVDIHTTSNDADPYLSAPVRFANKKRLVLGIMNSVRPSNHELFFLRLSL